MEDNTQKRTRLQTIEMSAFWYGIVLVHHAVRLRITSPNGPDFGVYLISESTPPKPNPLVSTTTMPYSRMRLEVGEQDKISCPDKTKRRNIFVEIWDIMSIGTMLVDYNVI